MTVSSTRRRVTRRVLVSIALAIFFTACGNKPNAELVVSDAYFNVPPKGAMAAGGFMTVHNGRKDDYRLVSAEMPGFSRVEIHETTMIDGMMRMRPQSSVAVAAGQTVSFQPGGLHLMLMQPQSIPAAGDSVTAQLAFESADGSAMNMQVIFEVRDPIGAGHGPHH